MALCLKAGDRLGPYQVRGECGIGGTAHSYKVFRADGLGDRFAKVFMEPTVKDKEFLPERVEEFEFLQKEMKKRLDRVPFGARILDFDIYDQHYVKVTELIAGEELGGVIRGASPERRWDLALRFCEALKLAHAEGVANLDLKPDNVIVTRIGAARMIDFDAGWVDCEIRRGVRFRRSCYGGTDGYFAPETLLWLVEERKVHLPEFPADVFAAGLVLFEVFSGRRMATELKGEEPAGVLLAATTKGAKGALPQLDRVMPRLANPKGIVVAGEVAGLVESMLKVEAAQRPTMAQVFQRLGELRILEHGPRPAPQPTPGELQVFIGGRRVGSVRAQDKSAPLGLDQAADPRWKEKIGRVVFEAGRGHVFQAFVADVTLNGRSVPRGLAGVRVKAGDRVACRGVTAGFK